MKMKKIIIVAILMSLHFMAYSQKGPSWLKKAVFYQIYPSSYMDSNGDGVGDIHGIISKLDYIKSVGVNVLWLNPVCKSGWKDGGYDVIDFYTIDTRFGTNSDFVELVKEAHKRGLRICMDLVAGHTSTECPWFKQSMEADANLQHSDYYIWTNNISEKDKNDIVKRHSEPNPATSVIGQFVEANAPRARYYLKNFFESQPALNYGYYKIDPDCPWQQPVNAPGPSATRQELKNIISFWVGKGVDGFRVDMAGSLVKNDPDQIATVKLWQDMRKWYDATYPDHVLIAEWSNPEVAIPAGFNIDFMIHFGQKGYASLFFGKHTFSYQNDYDECYFDLSGKGHIDTFINNYTRAYNKTKDIGYISIPTSNHDFQRPNVGTRNTLQQLKVAMTFFLTMPGVPFIYYGDEIGMKFIPKLYNKEGSYERSGSRTPMQWSNGKTAGFSTCTPEKLYLPVNTENGRITVETEEAEPSSMLHFVRKLLRLRKESDALGNDGGWKLLSSVSQPYPLVFLRESKTESYVVAINPSAKKVVCNIPCQKDGRNAFPVSVVGKGIYKITSQSDRITLGAISSMVFKLK